MGDKTDALGPESVRSGRGGRALGGVHVQSNVDEAVRRVFRGLLVETLC